MKALVVDDSLTIRRIIIKALGIVGVADTVEASDGAEAVKIAGEQQFFPNAATPSN